MIIPVRGVGDVLFGPITMRLTQFTKLLWKMIGLSIACDEEMAVQQWIKSTGSTQDFLRCFDDFRLLIDGCNRQINESNLTL